MEIICPECQFGREVDETKIPARSAMATCPKCRTKFQFRDIPEDDFVIEEQEETSTLPTTPPAQTTHEEIPSDQAETVSPTPKNSDKKRKMEEESDLPSLTAPNRGVREGLWEKLDSMRPPETSREQNHTEEPREKSYQQKNQEPVPGWTGEFNEDFPDPMQESLKSEEEEHNSILVPPPFEQLDRYGFFPGLFLTIKLILTSPKLFFSVMPVGGGLSKPLAFAILLPMIQELFQFLWGLGGLSPLTGNNNSLTNEVSSTAMLTILLLMPAVVTAGQFLMAGLYHLLLKLTQEDRQGFEGTFRVLAYSNTPVILGLFPMPTMNIQLGWMCITVILRLALTVVGLKQVHSSSYSKIIPITLIPILLAMIAGFYSANSSGLLI